MNILRKEAEKVKILLSNEEKVLLLLENLIDDIPVVEINITINKFEDICRDLFEQIEKQIYEVF